MNEISFVDWLKISGPTLATAMVGFSLLLNAQWQSTAMLAEMNRQMSPDRGLHPAGEGLGQLDHALTRLDSTLGRVDGSLSQLDRTLGKLDGCLQKLDGSLDKLDGTLHKLERALDKLAERVGPPPS